MYLKTLMLQVLAAVEQVFRYKFICDFIKHQNYRFMLKKIIKIFAAFILLIIIAIIAIPYFFKNQINEKIVQAINQKLNAKVSFTDADLSLLKSFPDASINIKNILILNKAPFEGDTLVSLAELNLKMSVKELFKDKNEAMQIDGIDAKNGLVNILFNKDGLGNYDIFIKQASTDTTKSKPLALKIKAYSVENLKFNYYDERSKINFVLDSLQHTGLGNFAASQLDLSTKTATVVTLMMDKNKYINKVKLALDAVLAIDLDKNKYTFKNNTALINQLPLSFDGFIQLKDAGQDYDLRFKTPNSNFQNFLGLIPSAYSGSLKDVKTTGNFKVDGFVKGLYTAKNIPQFNISIAAADASFKYPNLPKTVKNIHINTKIINQTGLLNDTYVAIEKMALKIDNDIFEAKGDIKNIVENPIIAGNVKGTINLANLSQAYPIKLNKNLAGILNANVKTSFDMNSVKTNKYQNIKNEGTMSLSGFKYTDDKGKVLNISKAAVVFNPSRVNLQQFNATTGKTDLDVKGTLDNFYGFLFNKQELKGNFNLKSTQFNVSDFITAETDTTKKSAKAKEAIKIPAFLNCALTANAATVLYNNLVLKNVSGKMLIKDQKVSLQNIKTSIFDGNITLNGDVSTKTALPVFNMELGLDKVDIQKTFTQLEMIKKIAPFAGFVQGKLNSTIHLSGNLDAKEMTPNLKTLTGDLLGQLLATSITSNNSPLFNALTSNIKFIDVKKLNLNDLKAFISFKDGNVVVKPFDLKYQDVGIKVGGTHSFDQVMNYNIKLDVPAKYLGTQANALLAKLSPAEVNNLQNIPVNAIVSGTFKQPKVTTDIKSASMNLATQLVNNQKNKLLKQGSTALDKLLGSSKSDTSKAKPGTVKDELKKKASDLLKGLF